MNKNKHVRNHQKRKKGFNEQEEFSPEKIKKIKAFGESKEIHA